MHPLTLLLCLRLIVVIASSATTTLLIGELVGVLWRESYAVMEPLELGLLGLSVPGAVAKAFHACFDSTLRHRHVRDPPTVAPSG